MLKTYVDMLIRNLQDDARQKKVTNMVQEYNFTTFDIIGDFAFGEPFHMLKTRKDHPFIGILFGGTRILTKITAVANSFQLHEIVKSLTTYGEKFSKFKPMEWIHEKVGARISAGELQRPDLFTNILRAKKEYGDQMPTEEIDAVAAVLLGAGSETTATLLSGLTNFLLINPEWMGKLKAEIRNGFERAEDVSLLRLNRLPILQAVVEESLRLYPPVPVVMARISPPGGTIVCGHFIPENMIVGVPFYASHVSSKNFYHPLEFRPERWLKDAPPEFMMDKKASLQPFSAGPRNCVGRNLAIAEIKMIVARVLYQFELEAAGPEKVWSKQKVYTLWEKSPLFVRLTDRTF
jgi:cytochrome P450